jgi:hypothetical protein
LCKLPVVIALHDDDDDDGGGGTDINLQGL